MMQKKCCANHYFGSYIILSLLISEVCDFTFLRMHLLARVDNVYGVTL